MSVDSFVLEAWIWFPITMTVVVARYVSRFLQVKSIRKLDREDLCMLLVAGFYMAEVIYLVKLKFTPTNLISPDETLHLDDPTEVALRIYGSKLIVAQEMNFFTLIWGTKACLLLFYSKMTYALPGSFRWTQITAIYVGVGYVIMLILYVSLWCRPFYNYWSVPVADPQCATAEDHLILNFALNVSSDLMILGIPLPLLARSKLPLGKKVILMAAFSLGLFVIMSAAMNRYYSFTHLTGAAWVYWFVREASTAVIVANVPHLWWLVRKAFHLNKFISNTPTIVETPSSAPSRFYDSHEDPLSRSRSPLKNTRISSVAVSEHLDIDMMLAHAEAESVMPPQPVRFRDSIAKSAAGPRHSDAPSESSSTAKASSEPQPHESESLSFITVQPDKMV